ncbi:Membrane associated serine protease, rhomboid family [Nonlabens sp. Hel1_33_55]|uniref:rhomboid family intramembrane serine protease n=1 Tax=Nonlabens sp. Hel1_33_55 TaxID=1336802 RepID=UPI000875D501|nr:rhomboid family intramembrane serine protease [Nonlabens sp. Hel1_33_55]SCY14550.1 Membrane associated serine protease, rhomboid family [Nonlabens sp. Hel1_33_55]
MDILDNIKLKYATLNVVGKLVAVITLATLLFWLLAWMYPPIYGWFALPSRFVPVILQPWSWLTYGFMHGGLLHLFFNMLILYFTGQMMLNLFSGRQFLTLFFTGVISGGLAFTLVSEIFVSFFSNNVLVGASAGVYAILFFICSYMPETQVRLFFILNVKLKYLGIALIVFDVIAIATNTNAGGSVAHLAGAAVGYYSATRMKAGIDILEGFAGIGDGFVNLFKSKSAQRSKSRKSAPKKNRNMKTVYRNATKTAAPVKKSSDHQQRIDAILDKISASGYESLSRAEKDFLFKAGKD